MSTRISKKGIYISKDERFCEDSYMISTILSYTLKEHPDNFIPSKSLRRVEQELCKLFPNYNFYFTAFFGDKDFTILSIINQYNHSTKHLGLSLVESNNFFQFVEVEESYVDTNSVIELYKLDMV